MARSAVCIAATVLLAAAAAAQEKQAPASAVNNEIKTFCGNIADAARDQRYRIQKQELEELQAGIDKRVKIMEERKAEYEDWLARRNAFLESAEEGLVEIYKNMRADAAAKQLELVDTDVAAAIIMKLNPRQASQILNEMEVEKAAGLAGIIASAADKTTSRNPS